MKQQKKRQSTSVKKELRCSKSEMRMIKDKTKLIQLQTLARRLDHRVHIQKQILEKNLMFQELQKLIKQQQDNTKNNKQDIIKNRLDRMNQNRRQRYEQSKTTNLQVSKILSKEKEKQVIAEQHKQRQKMQKIQEYQKAIKQRRQIMRKPIDFQQIDCHQIKYEYERRKKRSITAMDDSTHNPEDIDITKLLSNRSRIETVRKISQKVGKSALQYCYEKKKKLESQTEHNKQYWKKIKSYGNRVQKQYHQQRVKTQAEPTFGQKIAQELDKKIMDEKKHILSTLKKPKLPFQQKSQRSCQEQISYIQKLNISAQVKMSKLNKLGQIYENRLKLKKNPEYLDNLTKINMAKIQLMFQQK